MPKRQSCPVTTASGKYSAVRASDLKPLERPLPAKAAVRLIEVVLQRPRDLLELQTLARAIYPHTGPLGSGLPLRSIRTAFETGRWVLLARATGGILQRAEEDGERESVQEQLRTAKELKTWVEMEVVDEDGRPMAGEPFVCMLPDGRIIEGKLDGRGKVRFDGIDPGNCAFSLSRRGPDAWRRA